MNTNRANEGIKRNGTKHGTTLSKNISLEKYNLQNLQDIHNHTIY